MVVKDLIENGRWREPKIRELFPHHLVDDILAIPIALSQSEDHRFWLFDPRGKYTVRDGYKVATGFYEPPESSSTSRMEGWWKFLWALSIPPKVRIFCCRAILDIIPTEQNLLAHHVPTSGMCPLCHYSCDSSCHALFMCPLIKACWLGTSFWPTFKKVGHLSTIDIFLWMKENLSKIDFERFVVRAWATWNERLSLIHKKKDLAGGTNSDWSEIFLNDFQMARKSLYSPAGKNQCHSPEIWMGPPEDKLKLDVDDAYNEGSNSFAIGGVVRNHEGQPVMAFGSKIDKPQSVTYAELLAIEGGLHISHERNLQIYHITSDSLLAVQAVTSLKENFSYVGSKAKDIRILLDPHSISHLSHVRRSANEVAHSLAPFASSSSSHFVWEVGDFPLWLIHLVTKDIFTS
ncbi:uncharacterized protein LOC142538287 [Primulina tabacum]|uniref:uncharacterized protein LOC142538287 n=1 Tax=Primulina tabacum TaxID=48773 RepID=UPI003F59EB5D